MKDKKKHTDEGKLERGAFSLGALEWPEKTTCKSLALEKKGDREGANCSWKERRGFKAESPPGSERKQILKTCQTECGGEKNSKGGGGGSHNLTWV